MTFVLGCDPGKTGAIVAVSKERLCIVRTPHMKAKTGRGEEILYAKMWEDLKRMLTEVPVAHAFIERVQAMRQENGKGEGASSAFKFGYSAGFLKGLITALEIPHDMVEPQAWKKTARIPHGTDKKGSIARACELWPKHADELTPKRNHWTQEECFGVCDAALIGWHGLHLLSGAEPPSKVKLAVVEDEFDF